MKIDRRQFLKNSIAAGSAATLAPYISQLSARESANSKVNIAYIGVGGHGHKAAVGYRSENTVGFCDVDDAFAAKTYKELPDVPRFRDFRKMFDKLGKGIDAVSIATPDHTHYPIAMEAMQRGYHVYLEKPMAHSIDEMRTLAKAAKKYGVVSQLGVQGHSFEALRILKEWIDSGVIGDVLDVHLWTDRPNIRDYHLFEEDAPAEPIPDTLDWDLFLGPARYRPYNSIYTPVKWRGWWDFGGGPLGDIGAHMWDVVEFCLGLGKPHTITAKTPRLSKVGTPRWIAVDYFHHAKPGKVPTTVHWYSGERLGAHHIPAKLPYLPEGFELKTSDAMYWIGKKGAIYIPGMRVNGAPRILPDALWNDFRSNLPPKTLPRIKGNHYTEFFDSIRNHRPANANFDYGALINESVLLGNLAVRTGKTIHWDDANMKALGVPEADQYIYSPEPRKGWDYKL